MQSTPPSPRGLRAGIHTILISAALAVTSAAATRTVGTSGFDFTSLQAAINAANPGDVIDVRNTITEKGILIDKNLTIKSTLSTPQIIQAAATPGTANDRVFYIFPTRQVSMENLVIRHGVFGTSGGGIENFGQLSLLHVRVEKNSAPNGGGIFSQGAGSSVTLTECTVESNTASSTGGGLYGDSSTVMTVQRCTFDKNRAFEGGAIMNRVSASLTVTNSTISMNLAANGGAGIFNTEGGTTAVNSCTFSQNSLRAIQNNNATANSFTIRNSILANSLTSAYLPGGQDCAVFSGATITDQGYNIVENPNGVPFTGTNSVTGVDPQIGVLGDFGGPTRTHINGSPTWDNGNSGGLTVDQRGTARPQDGVDDRGAMEFKSGAGENTRPAGFCAPLVSGGEIHFAEFRAQEFRSPHFAVEIQNAAGGFDSFSPNFYHHGTYLGTADDLPGAIAGATYFPNARDVYWHLIFEDGKEWDFDGTTTTIRGAAAITATSFPGIVPGAGGAGSSLYAAEVAVDLPNNRYTTRHGSDANDALAMIEHSIMAANLIYMRQEGIEHRLGRVIIRGSAAKDPYAGLSTHDHYLSKVTDQWTNVLYTPAAPGTHDMATVIRAEASAGLAGVGNVGSPKGYSSCDATARGDFSGVFRHEGGHNWFLNHFDGEAPEDQTINSGNQIGRFSGPEQALILYYRNKQTAYLDNLGAATVPIPPSAATDRAFLPSLSSSININLLANDHDANGEALTLVSFSTASELTLGGTLSSTTTPGVVKYTPPASPPFLTTAYDRFRYRIRDASGQEAVGFVFVRLNNELFSDSYSQNFNSFANGTQSLGDGSYIGDLGGEGWTPVSVQGQALRLTPDVTGQNSSFIMPRPFWLTSGFNQKFRFNMSSASTPADYIRVNFGTPNTSRMPFDGLTVEFNTYAQRGFIVKVNSVEVAGGFVANTALANGQWHDVNLTWLPTFGLTMTVDSTPIFSNLALPGFTPPADSMLAFSAFTGGLSQTALVDDIVVKGATIDSDADGIPATYEGINGLNDGNAADAASDNDHDGFSALFEYQIGTMANSGTSKPVWNVAQLNNSTMRLTYGPITKGTTYTLKSSTGGSFGSFDIFSPGADAATRTVDRPRLPAEMFILSVSKP